jgi:hypothetical protein
MKPSPTRATTASLRRRFVNSKALASVYWTRRRAAHHFQQPHGLRRIEEMQPTTLSGRPVTAAEFIEIEIRRIAGQQLRPGEECDPAGQEYPS